MKKSVVIPVVLLFLTLFLAEAAIELNCDTDGSFSIKNSGKKFPVSLQLPSGEFIDAPGEWVEVKKDKNYNFYGDEGTFINKKPTKQKIKLGKNTKTLNCPAFVFSCRIFNLSIDYCYTIDGTFHAKYSVYNFNFDEKNTLRFEQPFVFRYDLVHSGQKRLTHAPTVLSPEFAELNITMRKLSGLNKFILASALGPIKPTALEIRYENCNQRKFNLFEWKACVQQPACTINKDCTGDEQCLESFCQKLVCSDCQYAVNNTCLIYECCDDSSCATTAFCQENTCQPLACAQTQAITEHRCTDLACADDEFTEEHQCKKLLCTEEEAPKNHACVKLECAGDEQVLDHQCVPLKCGFFQRAVEHECVSWVEWVKRKFR